MNRKRYFNEIKKKKEICLHQLFSKLYNYFSTKSPRTSIQFHQCCTSFLNLSTSCFVTQICWPHFSISEPPYPVSYCTHINTLITINGLHSSVNLNWTFSTVKNSITACCLNRTSENSSISMCTQ